MTSRGWRVNRMLTTPFGEIIVKLNGALVKYHVEELPLIYNHTLENPLFIVDGRCKIVPIIDLSKIIVPFRLSCYVDCAPEFINADYSGLETGERLFLTSLYHNEIKMSIGAFDELDGLEGSDFSLNGIEIAVTIASFAKEAFFVVAWKTLNGDDYETNGDVDTWFAADPSYI
jgi:hypothetical protein